MMAIKSIFIIAITTVCCCSLSGQKLKPYTIGAVVQGSVQEVAQIVENNLKTEGFEILGSYMPIDDDKRWVIVYTSEEILAAVKKIGGLTGFASAWRVAITDEGSDIIISHTTPEYWGNAYYRKDFEKVESLYQSYSKKLTSAMSACGTGGGLQFGSEKGHDIDKLKKYRYMIGMANFSSTKRLNKFDSFNEAVSKVDKNLTDGVANLHKVYSVTLNDQQIKLYGIGLGGENGESKFMPKIDVTSPKHTAFLPYEILIVGKEVHMLHGRYRIALSFPDLKMGQFMKIVSTPPNIKKMMERATK